jgi:hypothetical protein
MQGQTEESHAFNQNLTENITLNRINLTEKE